MNKLFWRFLKKKYKSVDTYDIIKKILKRRGYSVDNFEGHLLYSKEFVYVILKQKATLKTINSVKRTIISLDEIVIGNDINSNLINKIGQLIDPSQITSFLISLKYYERLN